MQFYSGKSRSTHPRDLVALGKYNEETWATLMVKFPPKDHAVVSATVAAAAAVLPSATEADDESVPVWRPHNAYAQVSKFPKGG